jgi:hypothetical protein
VHVIYHVLGLVQVNPLDFHARITETSAGGLHDSLSLGYYVIEYHIRAFIKGELRYSVYNIQIKKADFAWDLFLWVAFEPHAQILVIAGYSQ